MSEAMAPSGGQFKNIYDESFVFVNHRFIICGVHRHFKGECSSEKKTGMLCDALNQQMWELLQACCITLCMHLCRNWTCIDSNRLLE